MAAVQAKEMLPPDWERIEFEYRRNILSLREIAAPYDVTEAAIRKRAKKYGWERDINQKVQEKAKRIAAKKEAGEKAQTEAQLIEVAAEGVAGVMMLHKSGLSRMRSVCEKLLGELETQGLLGDEELQAMATAMGIIATGDVNKLDPADIAKAVANFRKLLSLGSRVDTFKKLVESHAKLIDSERVAHGIDDGNGSGERDVVSALKSLAGGSQ